MRKLLPGTILFLATFAFVQTLAIAQNNSTKSSDGPFKRLELIGGLQRPPRISVGKLEQIEFVKNGFGWARTATALWTTNDKGQSWRQITPGKINQQRLSGASFVNENTGFVILADRQTSLVELARTTDGGQSWTQQAINLPGTNFAEANLDLIGIDFNNGVVGKIALQTLSSSNFINVSLFSTDDGGLTWRSDAKINRSGETSFNEITSSFLTSKQKTFVKINNKDFEFFTNHSNKTFSAPLAPGENVSALDFADNHNGWLLAESGRCSDFKSGCEQAARLLATNDGGGSWFDITPQAARQTVSDNGENLMPSERTNVFDFTRESQTNVFLPPAGATRISLNRGFDKCTAAPVAQMQTWWNESPFYDVNIYISGRNRGCAQPQLSASWVNQVSAQGWGLIPTIVGYQAPCSVCANCQKLSFDATVAEAQGRGEADIAITDANNLGLTAGTVLYYDMERYDDLSGTGACSTPVKAFLKGWTDRLHEQNYLSGTYGSPTNAINDWVNIPAASLMDAVWMARWNNNPSVWGTAVAPLTDLYWRNHQRIHQYQAPANATWGGITFNIDGNISDGPVAGVRPARNKRSDFDGDGKSDIAVFRPVTGTWYWLGSQNNSLNSIQFGAPGDVITPGDYDNDGRTDVAVFRPETGIWYELSANPARPNANVLRNRQFGAAGDIPVAADYDGDGNTDLAVYRQGTWFITPSFDRLNPNLRGEAFGAPDDIPVPGDYDADGKTDLAVFRPSTGVWYVSQSSLGFTFAQFGASGDRPVQGDYDNDGKTDLAVFRPETGVWYLLQSSAGFAAIQFGSNSDQPAPGDFDGDGKYDPAVFRPNTGTWFVLQSQAGFTAIQFGADGDKPVPTGYLP